MMRGFVRNAVLSFVFWTVPLVTTGQTARAEAQAGTVEGDVFDIVTREPIPGAQVRLEQVGSNSPRIAHADNNGHFRFTDAPFGEYDLTAESPGFFRSGELEDPQTAVQGLVISSRRATAFRRLALRRFGVITGKITKPSGSPAAHIAVEVLRRQQIETGEEAKAIRYRRRGVDGPEEIVSIASAETNDRGEYQLWHLLSGTYYVAAQPAIAGASTDYKAFRTTYYPQELRAALARPIEVVGGEEVRNIDIQLRPQSGVRVSGRLVRPPQVQLGQLRFGGTEVWISPERAPREILPVPNSYLILICFQDDTKSDTIGACQDPAGSIPNSWPRRGPRSPKPPTRRNYGLPKPSFCPPWPIPLWSKRRRCSA